MWWDIFLNYLRSLQFPQAQKKKKKKKKKKKN